MALCGLRLQLECPWGELHRKQEAYRFISRQWDRVSDLTNQPTVNDCTGPSSQQSKEEKKGAVYR
jgi:hypothetical protein